MFSDYPPSFYTGWKTVCPRLLSPDAAPVPYLLTPGRLVRPPSPTPTMSSEDEPVQRTTVSGQQQLPLLPPPPVPHSAQPSSAPPSMAAPPSKESSAPSDGDAPEIRSAIFNTQKMSEEPSSLDSTPTFAIPSAPASNGSHIPPRPSRWTKARSTSTESCVSSIGIPPTLGSQYNQEGFPNYPVSSEDEDGDTRIMADGEAIAKQLAQTDEAVRQINGTASVVQARNLGNMMPSAPSTNQYELPRSMAAYVQRQPRGDHRFDREPLKTGGSFVSSGSSTSSEESVYFGSVEWVNTATQPNSNGGNAYPFYYTNPGKMPPPPTIRNPKVTSPRRASGNALATSGPATPNAMQNKGLPPTSAQQDAAASAEGPADNEDDDQTVGGPREGSPSSSSASGLDLLIHAAEHHDQRNRSSTYIKRLKGAEAVAQWRQSGIPTGTSRPERQTTFENSPGYESTPSDGQPQDNGSAEPPKKRRRSEMKPEAPDASLRNPPSVPSEDSDIESQNSASDSEYHGGQKRNRRNSAKGKQKARVRATLPMPPPGASPSPDQDSPVPSGKKGPPKARRQSNTSDTKPGALPAGGVQCEYINPLPPYQRCPDVFTRKYDIPRHMARHARREGDLVNEGKLPEEKAILWRTIRDKPRIRCKVCLEYFTR